MQPAPEWLGHLHPVVIHFPIAFALAAAIGEIFRPWRDDGETIGRAVAWASVMAAVFALIAAGSGWILAEHRHIRSDRQEFLVWHRWLEIGATLVLWVAAVACVRWRGASTGNRAVFRRVTVWIGAVAITIGSHMGGVMIWGPDWLS